MGDCAEGGAYLAWRGLCAGYSLSTYGSGDPMLPNELLHTIYSDAAAVWRQAPCDPNGATTPYFGLYAFGDTATPTGYLRGDANANTISFNSEWLADRFHDPDQIAITIVTFDHITGDILDADIEINTRYYEFTADASLEMTRIDLPSVLVHEFGHFQGLSHNAGNPAAIMYTSLHPGERRRELNSDDVAGICAIYPPGEAPAGRTCNLVPNGGFSPSFAGGRVTGACAISYPGGRGSTARGVLVLAALGAVLATHTRRHRN